MKGLARRQGSRTQSINWSRACPCPLIFPFPSLWISHNQEQRSWGPFPHTPSRACARSHPCAVYCKRQGSHLAAAEEDQRWEGSKRGPDPHPGHGGRRYGLLAARQAAVFLRRRMHGAEVVATWSPRTGAASLLAVHWLVNLGPTQLPRAAWLGQPWDGCRAAGQVGAGWPRCSQSQGNSVLPAALMQPMTSLQLAPPREPASAPSPGNIKLVPAAGLAAAAPSMWAETGGCSQASSAPGNSADVCRPFPQWLEGGWGRDSVLAPPLPATDSQGFAGVCQASNQGWPANWLHLAALAQSLARWEACEITPSLLTLASIGICISPSPTPKGSTSVLVTPDPFYAVERNPRSFDWFCLWLCWISVPSLWVLLFLTSYTPLPSPNGYFSRSYFSSLFTKISYVRFSVQDQKHLLFPPYPLDLTNLFDKFILALSNHCIFQYVIITDWLNICFSVLLGTEVRLTSLLLPQSSFLSLFFR